MIQAPFSSRVAVAPASTGFGVVEARRRRALRTIVVVVLLGILTGGCASYRGTARAANPRAVVKNGEWLAVRSFPEVRQQNGTDCGAAVLAAMLKYWRQPESVQAIESALGRSAARLRAGDMVLYARSRGLHSYVFFGTMSDIVYELGRGRPVIVGLAKDYGSGRLLAHYELVLGYEPARQRVLLLDPGKGFQLDELAGFAKEWALTRGVTIVAFLPPRRAAPD